jgi:sugar phosphate isomerase/epimerase
MKFAVFTVMMPEIPYTEAPALLKKYGYDGVEWRFTSTSEEKRQDSPSFWGNNLCTLDSNADPSVWTEVHRLTEQAGLTVPNIASYITCGDLQAVEQAMKAAVILQAPSIRVGAPGYDRKIGFDALFQKAREFLSGVSALSEQYGIQGLVEIHHNTIIPSASAARRLVEGFDPKRIGVIYDSGNMVYEGYEQTLMGLQILGEYLAHVHVKNAKWAPTNEKEITAGHAAHWQASWEGISKGIIHWPQVIQDLKSFGYDGWLSFEDFSGTLPTDIALKENLAYIRSLL